VFSLAQLSSVLRVIASPFSNASVRASAEQSFENEFVLMLPGKPVPILKMMQVNMVALTHLTGLFLPGMIQRQMGKILNVASTAAFQPGPLMAVYYASKAFVLSFSEALANELQHTGVTVTALCPGATASGFQKRANMEESKLFRGRIMDAQTVAKAGYRGLMANKTVVIPGLRHRMLAFSVRLTPRKVVTSFVRNLQERV
jgi:uncharacterized protein